MTREMWLASVAGRLADRFGKPEWARPFAAGAPTSDPAEAFTAFAECIGNHEDQSAIREFLQRSCPCADPGRSARVQ